MKVLGIDIGGSGIKGAPVDTDTGKLLDARFRLPTPSPAKPRPVAEVVGEIAVSYTHLRAHETAYTISFSVVCL